jgi:hypothetical protein
LALDCPVGRVYATQRTLRRFLTNEHDFLSIADCREKPSDRIAWDFTGEEKPVDSPVQRELCRRTSKDQQYEIWVAPDFPYY